MLTLLKVPQQRNTEPVFQGTVSCFFIKCSSAHLLLSEHSHALPLLFFVLYCTCGDHHFAASLSMKLSAASSSSAFS